MAKKLTKTISGSVLTIKTEDEAFTFDIEDLSDSIRYNLALHGMSQKLGDAAAGKEGDDISKGINAVWAGLVKGDWSVRAPAAEKVNKKDILANVNQLPEADKLAALELLRKLGMTV